MLLLAILGFITISRDQSKRPAIKGLTDRHSRPTNVPTRPISSDSSPSSNARPAEDAARPPSHVSIVRVSTVSPDTSTTRRERAQDVLPRSGTLRSARTLCPRSVQGDLPPSVNPATKGRTPKRPEKCRAVTEGRIRRSAQSGSAAKLKSASMPHLPEGRPDLCRCPTEFISDLINSEAHS